MADNLKSWVSDRLHDVLGFSDKYAAEFLLSLAKNATSHESLVDKISEGFSVDKKMSAFAAELWDKVPHKVDRRVLYRAREKAFIEQQQKNASYKLVSDDDDDDDDEHYQEKAKTSKKDKKRKHLRQKEVQESSSSEEEKPSASKKALNDSDSDEWDKAEEQTRKDLEERDAFAERLKVKDKEKIRNIMERSDTKVSGSAVSKYYATLAWPFQGSTMDPHPF